MVEFTRSPACWERGPASVFSGVDVATSGTALAPDVGRTGQGRESRNA